MGDMLFGVVVLVVFLALVLGAGLVLYRLRNARFTRVWRPLVPVVDGTTRGDGGGGAAGWLDGAYDGREVHARSAPGAGDTGRTGSTTTGYAYNAFEVVLVAGPGRQDWRLLHAASPEGGDPWLLVSDDPALVQRLRVAGVVERVASLGRPGPAITAVRLPVLEYSARDGHLHYREDAGPEPVPTPNRFRTELEVLMAVAEANARTNT